MPHIAIDKTKEEPVEEIEEETLEERNKRVLGDISIATEEDVKAAESITATLPVPGETAIKEGQIVTPEQREVIGTTETTPDSTTDGLRDDQVVDKAEEQPLAAQPTETTEAPEVKETEGANVFTPDGIDLNALREDGTAMFTEPQKQGIRAARQTSVSQELQQEGTFTTPSGAVIDSAGNIVSEPTQAASSQALQGFGLDGSSPDPFGDPLQYLTDTYGGLLQSMGISGIISSMKESRERIEKLQNERDDAIANINDNPWIGAESKETRVQKIFDKFSRRISNAEAANTREQDNLDTIRDIAQFISTNAMSAWYKNRQFAADELQRRFTRAERTASDVESRRRFELERVEDTRQFEIERAADIRDFNEAVRQFNVKNGGGGVGLNNAIEGLSGPGGATPQAINEFIAAVANSRDISGTAQSALRDVFNVTNAVAQLAEANPEGGFVGLGLGAGLSGLGPVGRITSGFLGVGQERFDNRGAIEGINLKVQRWASGAALTDEQTKQVGKMTPRQEDSDRTIVFKTNALYNFMLDQVESTLITEGVNVSLPRINLYEARDLLAGASPSQLEELARTQ